jgi:DNA-directed RNA polymerase specialized sigma24 family protein
MDSTIERLICEFRTGNQEAAKELYERFVGQMLVMVRRMLGTASNRAAFDSEGIVQSGFQSFFSSIQKTNFDSRKGKIGGLLVRIVSCKAYRQLRRKFPATFASEDIRDAREITGALLDAKLSEPEVQAVLRERASKILEDFTEGEHQILELYFDLSDERSILKIASLCQRSVTSVEKVINRFIEQLQLLSTAEDADNSGE